MPTTPRSLEAIHLLRALYRQASCFFDDQARAYLRTQIKARFKRCQKIELEHRQSRLLKHGRSVLSTIQRANLGDIKRITKILRYTYGQAGPRKHELLAPVIAAEPGVPLIPGVRRSAKPVTSPALKALITASRKRTFNEKEPVIPETNKWYRPFPLKREINICWKYHSRVLNRLPAPIPDNELVKLEKFISGTDSPRPPRRKNVIQQTYIEPDYPETHKITGRFKRRIYQKLLSEIPELRFDGTWYKTIWRDEKMPKVNDGSRVMDAFEGLDSKGRLVKPESSRDVYIDKT